MKPYVCHECGGKVTILTQLPNRAYYWIYCHFCNDERDPAKTKRKAIRNWNRYIERKYYNVK